MTTIDAAVREAVCNELSRIESEHDVRIVYACESGSRAWGFGSKDSDYDVRFLYVHATQWYLNIEVERQRDVIEVPIDDELDVNGWDVRKALVLFRKSNPPLYEWLHSPIVYREKGQCAARMRELSPTTYNSIAAHYHYLRMAENTYRAYLRGRRVRRKKYFYALRPLLALNWIERAKGVVPTQFASLVEGTIDDGNLLREIDRLLQVKREGAESDEGPRFPGVHDFIERELKRHHDAPSPTPANPARTKQLNELFRDVLDENAI
ncbi:MAG: nucleotidyltransferase domain-containing protein [Planctomycetota bacterium]